MTAEQQGLYRNLLDEIWLRESHVIPDDTRILAKVSGDPDAWQRNSSTVLKWMIKTDDGWTHPTALEVIKTARGKANKQARYRDRLRIDRESQGNGNGNAGVTRTVTNSVTNVVSPSPSPSPSPSLRTEGLKNNPSVRGSNENSNGNGHNPKPTPAARQAKTPPDGRVTEFLKWFQKEYRERRHGADYFVKWEKDAALVKRLLGATTPARLQNCAKVLLSEKTDEAFIAESDRGIGVLAAKFNWLSDRVAQWEARQRH